MKNIHSVKSPAKTFVAIVSFFLCIVLNNFGNIGEKSNRGFLSGSYQLSDLEILNNFSGSLNFRVPVGSVAGRGGFSYEMFVGTQNLWTVNSIDSAPPCQPWDEECIPPPQIHFFRATTQLGAFGPTTDGTALIEPTSVFTNMFVPILVRTNRVSRFERESELNQVNFANTMTTITVRTPDGAFHELYDTETEGEPFEGAYYNLQPPASDGFFRGRVFRSTDSSDITAISDTDIRDRVPGGNGGSSIVGFSGIILLKNGTRFTVSNSKVLSVKDRNGNLTSFTYTGALPTKIVSSNGNEINIEYGSEIDDAYVNTLRFRGTGGAERSIQIHYGRLHTALRGAMNGNAASTIQTLRQLFVNDAYVSNGNHDPFVLTSVVYPDGRSFNFKYNSYSELSQATLPTGGYVSYEYGSGFGSGTGAYWIGAFMVNRRIKERRVHAAAGDVIALQKFDQQTHSSNATFNGYTEEETHLPNASGNLERVSKTKHYFTGNPIIKTLPFFDNSFYQRWDEGKEYKTEFYDSNGTPCCRRSNKRGSKRIILLFRGGRQPRDFLSLRTILASRRAKKRFPIADNLLSSPRFLPQLES